MKRRTERKMKTLGERIAELRKERNMTQEGLASTIGISAQAISKWENNVTMPDITLLPLIADVFEVTIDELFSITPKPHKHPVNMEEIPSFVYDETIINMWGREYDDYAEKVKEQFKKNPELSTGFVSEEAGAVYGEKDLALVYLPSAEESLKLLDDEKAAKFLQVLSDRNVRMLLKYQLQQCAHAFTAASASTQTGISETDAKEALEKLTGYNLTFAQDVDVGAGEKLRVYQVFAIYKMPLLVYPLLTLAKKLSDFRDSWYGFRG